MTGVTKKWIRGITVGIALLILAGSAWLRFTESGQGVWGVWLAYRHSQVLRSDTDHVQLLGVCREWIAEEETPYTAFVMSGGKDLGRARIPKELLALHPDDIMIWQSRVMISWDVPKNRWVSTWGLEYRPEVKARPLAVIGSVDEFIILAEYTLVADRSYSFWIKP